MKWWQLIDGLGIGRDNNPVTQRNRTMPEQFEITIVYGTNKPLAVTEAEMIDTVKVGAMALFGIPESEKNQFVLRAKVDGKETQLNETQTVLQSKLHPHEKVTLASGTPYGGR